MDREYQTTSQRRQRIEKARRQTLEEIPLPATVAAQA